MKHGDDHNNPIPLLSHPLDQPSDFTPEALIEAVRTKRNMASVAVPEVCILEFDGDLTDNLVESRAVVPWPNWACFHTPMFALDVDGKPCGIVPRAIGGAYAVLVAEQLLASGARMVIGLTSAGRVSPNLRIPSLVNCNCRHSRRGHLIPLPATITVSDGTAQTCGPTGE